MAKVILPFLGVGASGTFGRSVVYQDRPGGSVVFPCKEKRDPKSAAQLAQRRKFSNAASWWSTLSGGLRAWCAEEGKARNWSGWNFWVHYVLVVGGKPWTVGDSKVGGVDLVS